MEEQGVGGKVERRAKGRNEGRKIGIKEDDRRGPT
jgi:hypothetical protein